MRRNSWLRPLLLAWLAILPVIIGLPAYTQPVVYSGTFQRHQYQSYFGQSIPDGMTEKSTVSFPISGTNGTGSWSGTIDVSFPATLPPATLDASGTYLLFGEQSVSTRYKASLTWTRSGKADDNFSADLEMATESGTSGRPLPVCRKELPWEAYKGPGSKTFELTLDCVWTRFPNSSPPGAPLASRLSSDLEMFVSGPNFFTALGFYVYTTYQYASPLDLSIEHIEPVQVTQKPDNSIPMIAEKPTNVRVFVNLGDKPSPPEPDVTASLRGYRGGAELTGSPIWPINVGGSITAPPSPQRDDPRQTLNFLLPEAWTKEGTLTLKAEVDPDRLKHESNTANNTKSLDVAFRPSRAFLINYLRVCVGWTDATGAPVERCPSDLITQVSTKLERVYPLRDGDAIYQPVRTPAWHWSRSLAAAEDWDAFMAMLRKRWELTERSEGVQADQLVAWLPAVGGVYPKLPGGYSDPVWAGSTGRVSFVQDSRVDPPGTPIVSTWDAATLAHEIGHNLGLRHPNTADSNGAIDPNTDWPNANARTQEPGLDPIASLFYPSTRYDLMSYAAPPGSRVWISPFHYLKLVNSRLQPQAKWAGPAAAASYLIVSGSALADGSGGSLDPIVPVDSATAPPDSVSDGNHCIRLSGPSGMLLERCFNLTFTGHRGEPLVLQHFVMKVPFAAGTTRVSLMRGNSELAWLGASSNAPKVSITSPTTGSTLQGAATVRWDASDADGDSLVYTLLYSSDNGASWLPIETDIPATEAQIQTAEMAAGSQILIRVVASDGMNSGASTVGPLTIVARPVIDATTSLDFGSIAMGQSATDTLHIANRGEKPLTIQSIASSTADFTVTSALPAVVAARGNANIVVRFAPAAAGTRAAKLTIASDDPASATVAASAIGSGIAQPQITSTPASLDFGAVAIGATSDLTTTLRNTGSGPLTIVQFANLDSQFRVTSPTSLPLSVPAGATATLRIQFRPAQTGAQFGVASISSDSVSNPSLAISLRGSGTGSNPSCYFDWSNPAAETMPAAGGTNSNGFVAPAGCAWTLTASAPWIIFTSAASGTGAAVVPFEARPNSGAERVATISAGSASFAIRQLGVTSYSIIPAVASTAGGFNAFFRTAVQLHNPTTAPISGQIWFHPMTVAGSDTDPTIAYRLDPGETQSISDLLPAMSYSGIGSVDVQARIGSLPIGTARVFNDAGTAGTSGMTQDLFRPEGALEKGDRGVLIAPPEPSRARYNIGLRSLDYGATLLITVRDRTGAARLTTTRAFPASYMIQQKAQDFLGLALLESDTVTFEVREGSVIVYGAANDNTTQDPTLQFARAMPGAATAGQTRYIPAVGLVHGQFGSNFRTALQLHNAAGTVVTGTMTFHPATVAGGPNDPTVAYTLQPGATTYYADLLQSFGASGLGSLDLKSSTGALPVTMARVFNDAGAAGTSGLSEEAMRTEDALQTGESGILLSPPDPAAARFNLGVRTLAQGATITVTQRDRNGQLVRTATKSYAPHYFEQTAASVVIGGPVGPSDSLTFQVTAGSAIVYGTTNDNITNDPSMQLAQRK